MEEVLAFFVSTWYLWLVVFGIVIFRLSMPRSKGYLGGKLVSFNLTKLDKNEYKGINNLMLKVGNKTTLIEHVIVSSYGIFVISSSSFRGDVFGKGTDAYWTHFLNKKKKEKLHNPIRQNLGNIQVIKEALENYKNINYVSIAVFTSKSNIKVETNMDVIHTSELKKTIEKYNEESITDKVNEEIFEKLASLNIYSKENRKAHSIAIKEDLKAKNKRIKY